eukprot:6965379-Pyramimonas_sp.AAC.1
MGTYTEPSRPVWMPTQSLHALCGILYRACTACVGSYTEPTRPVWAPIQNLHGLYGILYKACTAGAGSYTKPAWPVWDLSLIHISEPTRPEPI